MFGQQPKVVIKEYALPKVAGAFTLDLETQRRIVGVINKDGANILLVQERTNSSAEENNFELVETGATVQLSDELQYLHTVIVDGKVLHLFGEEAVQSRGGAASGF